MKRSKRVAQEDAPIRQGRREPGPTNDGTFQEGKGERLSAILERRRKAREEREKVSSAGVQRRKRMADETVVELGRGVQTPPPVAILASDPAAQRDWELRKYGKVHWYEHECLHCRGKMYPVRLIDSSSKRSKGLMLFCPACFFRAVAWT